MARDQSDDATRDEEISRRLPPFLSLTKGEEIDIILINNWQITN